MVCKECMIKYCVWRDVNSYLWACEESGVVEHIAEEERKGWHLASCRFFLISTQTLNLKIHETFNLNTRNF